MNKHITLLAAASSLLLIPSLASAAPAKSNDEIIAGLRDNALQADNVAYEIVEGLTTEIGPRQGGTAAEARARIWAVAKLKALGFENVRVEEYQMPTWVRGGYRYSLHWNRLPSQSAHWKHEFRTQCNTNSGWGPINTRCRKSGTHDRTGQASAHEIKTDATECWYADLG